MNVKVQVLMKLGFNVISSLKKIITGLKDVRAQNVPTHRFFLNLPRRKAKKMGGHRARFRDHEVHF